MSGRPSRLRAALVTGMLATAVLFLPGVATAAEAPTQQPPDAVELNKRVAPSIVFLEMTTSGYLGIPGQGWIGPIESGGSCTGFFVSGSGDVATAGHCVGPDSARESFIDQALGQLVEGGQISESQLPAARQEAMQSWQVAGDPQSGSPLSLQILAAQPEATQGAVLTQPVEAQLVDYREFDEGDTALLKLNVSSTPGLPIASEDPPTGTAITSIGFPGSVTKVVSRSQLPNPTFNSGTVASSQISPTGIDQIGINAAVSQGMSGGPTIDQYGNVVGVNSFKITDESQPFNFITDTTDLGDWLGSKGLSLPSPRSASSDGGASPSTPTPTSSSRSGVPGWLWAAVGLVVVLIVVGVVLALRRRGGGSTPAPMRVSAPQPEPSGGSAGPGWIPPGSGHGAAGGGATATATADTFTGDPFGARVTCPQCRTVNAAEDRFCTGCAGML